MWLGIIAIMYLPFSGLSTAAETRSQTTDAPKSSLQKIEENPRNRAFVESFQIIHSHGLIEKQEERKQKKDSRRHQKASP